MTTGTVLRFGERDLELGGEYLAEMRDSSALVGDRAALSARIAEDGYLLLRGLHRRDQVLEARRALLESFAAEGGFDPRAELMDAVIDQQPRMNGGFFGGGDRTSLPAFRAVVDGAPVMGFFESFLGERARTFDFKWMRLTGRDGFTGAHMDIVYMGRGSANLYTVWTPIGDVPYDQGPLAVLVGSNRLEGYRKIRETYGRMDVDRDHVDGWFSNDPVELVERFGGRWATSEFKAGDALVFTMYTMHASLTNVSNRFRLSADTRYQPLAEPADERWVGDKPLGHYGWRAAPTVPMDQARKEWGI
jgi:hypothetical protein